jgi:peptidoglycan/xylan/chitin deacetylase (PgdA/CDA1 family)
MKKYLTVTIDTEIDNPRGRAEFPYSLENIKAIPKLQDLFKKYGIKPTYLITYPVATDEKCVDILKKAVGDGAEIGAHLHPWTCPPFKSKEEKRRQDYPNNSESEREKLIQLTSAIEKSFGIKPISYRAGRYGVDDGSIDILKELGYKVDSSVTPTMNWSNDGGPDFSHVISTNSYNWNGILEVPITIMVKRGPDFYRKLSPAVKSVLGKLGVAKTAWLRPSVSSLSEMKWLSDTSEGGVLNMMFHSNELMMGTSLYTKTRKETEGFWQRLDSILNYLINEKQLESKTLCEL